MKYIKYILLVLLLLIGIFIAIGFITPSISYDCEISVDKPIKESWAVMNDESKTMDWLKGLTEVKHISGEKGKVGAVTEYTYDDNGTKSVIEETMKSIDPFKQVTMDFLMKDVMKMGYKIDFEGEGNQSTLKSSTTVEGQGMIMRSMMVFMKGTMIAQENENLANLKKVIEDNTVDYFPVPKVVMETSDME